MILFRFTAVPIRVIEDPSLQPLDIALAAFMLRRSTGGLGAIDKSIILRWLRCSDEQLEEAFDRLYEAGYLARLDDERSQSGRDIVQFEFAFEDDRTPRQRARFEQLVGAQ